MAKSKLIIRRKKSTILVSAQTLTEAIRRANALAEQIMNADQNDPRLNKIEAAVQHFSRILKANPQQMKQDNVQSIEDYMDDAKMPAEARKLKQEVDMIAQLESEQRGPAPAPAAPEQQGVGYVPDSAVLSSKKEANGAGFVTDRNEQGEAKMPEKLEVPRLAARKKKKEAEDPAPDAPAPAPVAEAAPAPAPVPEAAPAPAPSSGSVNPIDYIPTETLIKVIEDLPKEDDFAQNKGKQDALIELTNVLKTRPVLPPEAPEGQQAAPAAPAPSSAPALGGDASAAPAPVTAAKTAELGDHAMGGDGNIGGGSSPSHSINPSTKPSVSTAPKEAPKAPEKASIGFGGLEIASALEEEKTADDYRIQDYKITDEGVRPSGGLPSMDEPGHGEMQFVEKPHEMEMTPTASVEKTAVTPPGISEELMHKLKKQYPGEPDKAYATAWSIHNEKASALKEIDAALDKFASAGYGGGWFTSYKPMDVTEDGGRTPEIGEAHSKLEDHTGISHPETTEPIKLNEQQGLKTGSKVAAEMTSGKAVKESERVGNELKKMYLDAKSLTQVNDTRAVREAVEAIFRAADLFDEATKVLNKQDQQEKSEAEAAKIKAENKKKSSSFGGLAVAAGE